MDDCVKRSPITTGLDRRRFGAMLLAIPLVGIVGCGGSDSNDAATSAGTAATGIRVVSADQARGVLDNPPADLVVLDVRTPEEFADGHLNDAQLLDFYRDDFAEQLAQLDPDVPYLLYCRSGNRSGSTRALMEELGFANVADLDGGIISWDAAGHPIVRP